MKRRIMRAAGLAAALTAVCALVGSAQASFDGSTGQIQLIAPPAGVLFPPNPGSSACPVAGECLSSDTTMFGFNEQQCVAAPSDLPVDITVPGTYNSTASLTPGTITAGTIVSSQFVQSESVSNQDGSLVLDGTVHTDAPIIGIAVTFHGLNKTDVLGAPGTAYPTGQSGRGLELDNPAQNDFVVEVTDMHTVEIHSHVNLHADQVRIITSCPPPPPATIIVKKLTVPSGSTQSFSFTGDLAGSIQDQGTISKTVSPGTYQTTENVPAGWTLSNISCDDPGSSGNTATGTTTYNVSAGQTVTCTYTDSVVFAAGGNFVVGDLTVGPMSQAVGKSVNFWGSQWWKNNSLTGGTGPAAFKGFEDSLAQPQCGVNWTTDPGNSSNPPSTIPPYMGIIVSSNVTKSGPVISGDTPHIVIVKTNSGYGPNPGHPGTGTITSVVC
jgi:hypothetical protein